MLLRARGPPPALGDRHGWGGDGLVHWAQRHSEPGAAAAGAGVDATLYELQAEQKGEREPAYRLRKGQNRTLTESNPTWRIGFQLANLSDKDSLRFPAAGKMTALPGIQQTPPPATTEPTIRGALGTGVQKLQLEPILSDRSCVPGRPPPPFCPFSDLKTWLATMLGIHLVAGFHISDLS